MSLYSQRSKCFHMEPDVYPKMLSWLSASFFLSFSVSRYGEQISRLFARHEFPSLALCVVFFLSACAYFRRGHQSGCGAIYLWFTFLPLNGKSAPSDTLEGPVNNLRLFLVLGLKMSNTRTHGAAHILICTHTATCSVGVFPALGSCMRNSARLYLTVPLVFNNCTDEKSCACTAESLA